MIREGELSCEEVVRTFLERIEAVDGQVDAFVTVTAENALGAAKKFDSNGSARKGISRLSGVPIAVKDNMCTRGVLTTCSSKILGNFVPPYTATAVEKCEAAGLICIGKTNLDEFAMGSSTEHSAFKTTKNPYGLDRIPGGSSGGSTAAVAALMAPLALGSDTGGSIRQPASLCGVVGMKPTYGRVSRYGLVAFASSLDQIGPVARNVTDAAHLLNIISGHDPMDSTSADMRVPDFTKGLASDLKGIRIGFPPEYFGEGLDKEVRKSIEEAICVMESLGAERVEISLPHTKYAVATYYIVAIAEASSNLARYDGVKYGMRAETPELLEMYEKTRAEGFGAEVRRRIMLGTYTLSSGYYDAYYLKGLKVRRLFAQDFEQAFEKCHVIVTPASPTPAFKAGEKLADPIQMYLSDIYTIPANLAGLPGVCVPCGYSSEGLPIGLHITANAFDEETLLKAAHAYEQARGFELKPPVV